MFIESRRIFMNRLEIDDTYESSDESPDAIEVLRSVAEGYKQGQNSEVNQGILQAFQQMASAMEVMSKQQEDISELKKQVADLIEERHLQTQQIKKSSFFKRLFGK